MKHILQSLFLAVLIFSIYSCGSNEEDIYESCCGKLPIKHVFNTNDTFITIVNAFTPNGDQVNDYFYPSFNSIVTSAEYMIIRSVLKDRSNELLY